MNTTSGMNVGNANANPTLTRKLDKLFDMKLDQSELVESLKYLDNFYGKNSLTARRNLRGQIEKEGLQIHNDFLYIFHCGFFVDLISLPLLENQNELILSSL